MSKTGAGPIRVLVVDDSALFRSHVKAALSDQENIKVVGSAGNGQEALIFIGREPVDAVVLDVEMPEMDGLETTQRIRASKKSCKVILFSGTTTASAGKTIEALNLGATDFLQKPGVDPKSQLTPAQRIREILVPKINSLFFVHEPRPKPKVDSFEKNPPVIWETFRPSALVIASSTGGPTALENFFSSIDYKFPCPVLVAQHMPPLFTASLAERLSRASGKVCKEAIDGEEIKPDQIYIAPGNYHMGLVRSADRVQIHLNQSPLINYVRPAADILFKSAAEIYQRSLLGLVLTGMGQDGLEGCRLIKNKKGAVLIQDKESCVVFGMPGAVFDAGCYDYMGNIESLRNHVRMICTKGAKNAA